MRKGYREAWGRVGRVEKILLGLVVVYAFMRLSGLLAAWQLLVALALLVLTAVVAVKWTLRIARKAIWHLRNRLIVAYLFVAVVPIILIVALAGLSGWLLIGQVAAYFVRTGLSNQERNLMIQAEGLAQPGGRGPGGAPQGQGGGRDLAMSIGIARHRAVGKRLQYRGENRLRSGGRGVANAPSKQNGHEYSWNPKEGPHIQEHTPQIGEGAAVFRFPQWAWMSIPIAPLVHVLVLLGHGMATSHRSVGIFRLFCSPPRAGFLAHGCPVPRS